MISLIYFLIVFIFESAIFFSKEGSGFLFSLIPAIYFLEKEFRKETIKTNKFSIFYFLFSIFLIFSIFFSIDKINSFNSLLIWLTAFFIFLIGANERLLIFGHFKKILIFFSFLFSFLSLLPQKFFPTTAYQLVYPLYPNHNHLGDFLGLTLIILICDYLKNKKKSDLFLFLFFLPFFLFSYSRSAYVDFFVILLLIFYQNKALKIKKIIFLSLLVVILFFIFTQKELYQIKPFNQFLPFINQTLKFQPRGIVSGRIEYFSQGIKGFLEKPFFGWGVGNYHFASKKYVSKNLQQVSSALNLPITILTETGIFGFFFFFLFFLVIFKNIDKKLTPYIYLFYYLCLNFLTDYTYSIYGMFLFLFLLAGMVIKKEKKISFNLYPFFSFLVLFLIFLRLTGKILTFSGRPDFGILFYPFDHQTNQYLIKKTVNLGNIALAKKYALDYEKKSFMSFEGLSFLGDFYFNLGEKNYALKLYQRLTDNDRFPSLEVLKKVYWLKKERQGKREADSYFGQFFENFKTTFWLNPQFEDDVYQFCFQENIPLCRFRRFYSPKPKTVEKAKNLPIKATYTFNNDGFNERFNYSAKKPKNTFRILVLGDGNAFGFLVDTKDNWVEKLEDKLKSQISNLKSKYQKIEVINLSYHSFDLAYAIERFARDGIKYQPDLIIFMNNNFYRINEIFLPLTEKYAYLENMADEKEKLRKEGKYFPSWDLAWDEYTKKVKSEEVYQKQKKYLEEFFSLYRGQVVFICLSQIPQPIKEFLERKKQVRIMELLDFAQNKDYYFKEIAAINPSGHEKLAEVIFNSLSSILPF
ncbi:MAG: O-antigen ligase family protein [Microgenomates group bacterium]